MMTLYMHIFQGRYLFTNIASVIQIRQPQQLKTFRFDSQWGSGCHIDYSDINDNFPIVYSCCLVI